MFRVVAKITTIQVPLELVTSSAEECEECFLHGDLD